MNQPDLYATLHIDRQMVHELTGGDEAKFQEALKDAYRRASKVAHPDGGGTPEAFLNVKAAYETLRDPVKRARYHETGEVDPDEPNNSTVEVFNMVQMAFDKVLNQEEIDFRSTDAKVLVLGVMDIAIRNAHADAGAIATRISRVQTLRDGFKLTAPLAEGEVDLIAVMLDRKLIAMRRHQADIIRSIKRIERAANFVRGYSYDIFGTQMMLGYGTLAGLYNRNAV